MRGQVPQSSTTAEASPSDRSHPRRRLDPSERALVPAPVMGLAAQSRARQRQEPIQLSSYYVYSAHPGAPATTPYRPLSVVPQRPRLQSSFADRTIGIGENPFAETSQAHAGPVRWAEHAKRRAQLEHDIAEKELEAISNVFAVQVDVLLPEGRMEDIRRGIEAAKVAEEEAKRNAEIARAEAEARATEETQAKARAEAEEEERRLAAIPLVPETPVSAVLEFTAESEVELAFKEGEALSVLDVPAPDGWLMARNAEGSQGLIPESYVRLRDVVETPKGGLPQTKPTTNAPAPAASASMTSSTTPSDSALGRSATAPAGLMTKN